MKLRFNAWSILELWIYSIQDINGIPGMQGNG